jgi:hypothetical protein
MSNGKKQKSSGWQPHEKRFNPDKWKVRHIATSEAKVCARNDGLGRWRRCPVLRCRRAQCCAGDPFRCEHPARPKAAAKPNANQPSSIERAPWAAQPAASEQPRFAISAKDAAAAIAASIANDPQPEMLLDDELEAMLRAHPR